MASSTKTYLSTNEESIYEVGLYRKAKFKTLAVNYSCVN